MKRAWIVVLSLLPAGCRAPAPREETRAARDEARQGDAEVGQAALVEPAAHAYYLFVTMSENRDEYIPLILSTSSLEALSSAARDSEVVLITTYARDSIWSLERGVRLAAADVSPRSRVLRLRDVEYHYQEIAPAEVLRLLENPGGTISIHRIRSPLEAQDLHDLIGAFGGPSTRDP